MDDKFWEVRKRIVSGWKHVSFHKTYDEALNVCQNEGLHKTVEHSFT